MSTISIVMPCYNEASVVATLGARLNDILPRLAAELDVRFHLLFVDDGSRDDTVARLGDIAFCCPAEVVVLSRNFGKEAALSAGLEAARGDAVILMDSDLQHPPERIAEMVRHWRAGHEVVYYYKRHRNGEGRGRGLGSRLFYWVINLGSRVEVPANSGDFRLMDRVVVDALCRLPETQRFMKGLYAWVGFRQLGLPFEIDARQGGGGSRFTVFRLLDLAIQGLTSFSINPIRLISIFGMVVAALSLLYMAWIILERLFVGAPFSGFASLAVLVTFFGGIQFLCIGLVGEYVGRSLLETKRRPTFIVRERRALRHDGA